jgi:hypothetical protein
MATFVPRQQQNSGREQNFRNLYIQAFLNSVYPQTRKKDATSHTSEEGAKSATAGKEKKLRNRRRTSSDRQGTNMLNLILNDNIF